MAIHGMLTMVNYGCGNHEIMVVFLPEKFSNIFN